jgi:threonine/homoserine/homoserine lactone efflux protein
MSERNDVRELRIRVRLAEANVRLRVEAYWTLLALAMTVTALAVNVGRDDALSGAIMFAGAVVIAFIAIRAYTGRRKTVAELVDAQSELEARLTAS